MKFSFPCWAAVDGPGSRITPKRGAGVLLHAGCAARCCSGRSEASTDAVAKPNDELGPRRPATLAGRSRSRSPGTIRVAGWPAALDPRWRRNQLGSRRIAFRPSVLSVSGSPARQLSVATRGCRHLLGRTLVAGRPRAEEAARGLPHGSCDRSQFDSEDVPATLCRIAERFSPAAIVTAIRFSSGGIGQLHPAPYAQKGL